MADGREACTWNHTSHVLAAFINSNPFNEGEPLTPKQLNPYRQDEPEDEDEGPEMNATDLALLLCGPQAVEVFKNADKLQQR